MSHKVSFSVPGRPLGRAGIDFVVELDGTKFGTLRVRKGSLVWIEAEHTYGYKLGWVGVGGLAKLHGTNGHK